MKKYRQIEEVFFFNYYFAHPQKCGYSHWLTASIRTNESEISISSNSITVQSNFVTKINK